MFVKVLVTSAPAQPDGFQAGGDDPVTTGQENPCVVLCPGVWQLVERHPRTGIVRQIVPFAGIVDGGLAHRQIAGLLAEVGGVRRVGDECDELERVDFSLLGELGRYRQPRTARRTGGRCVRPVGSGAAPKSNRADAVMPASEPVDATAEARIPVANSLAISLATAA